MENPLYELGAVERIPDKERVFIADTEVMLPAEDLINCCASPFREVLGIGDLDDQVVDDPWRCPAFSAGGKSRAMEVGKEELGVVRTAAVAAVLLLP